jgi:acetyltransferase AlgX (SGNH hydrolase-like protein)
MRIPGISVIYTMFFSSLFGLFFCSGGLVVTFCEERVAPVASQYALLVPLIGVFALLAAACGYRLLRGCWLPATPRKDDTRGTGGVTSRHLFFSTLLFTILVAACLVSLNLAASFFAVSWPMSGLHGVSPDVGKKAWGYHEKADSFVPVNLWGQRDREHTIRPQPGTYRMIFIGDSLLEDGAPVPLPFRLEEILNKAGRTPTDIINLGVTATDPDEYFFRLKRIGLPLQPNHCVLTFSAGTDFIQEPTLLSYGGISATYPRWSFLQILGLNSLDHVISNERRQVLRAWFKGGSLLKHELELKEIFGKTVDDQDTERTYLSFFPPNEQAQLKAVLTKASAAERSGLFSMLRHPDDGKFRSYYLDIATKVAKGLQPIDFVSAEYSFRWVQAAYELCRKKNIKFTLVIIPDGFTVDSRMSGYYAAIADMKVYMKYKDDATNRFVSQAMAARMDVIDLRGLLQGKPGAYLNMEGHWSQAGVDAVANYLSERISRGPAAGVRGAQ